MNEIGAVTAASAWVQGLPKIELHIHLEGAMRSETVRDLSIERQGWTGPLPAGWERQYYTFTTFEEYMAQLTPRFPGGPDEYARIAAELFEDLAAMNVIHAEIGVDGMVHGPEGEEHFWAVMTALEEVRRQAEAQFGLTGVYIIGLMRTLPVEAARLRVDLALQAHRRGLGVAAIDLHGDESRGPASLYQAAYDRARAGGLHVRAHAGEAAGPESIWTAICSLHAERIGHGVRAVEDEALLACLQQGDVTLEVCPSSNVRTGVVPSLAAHPIRRLYDLGIPLTVNSDDPLPFFTSIEREYRLLVESFGFTRADLHRITRTAARASFLSADEREKLVQRVDLGYAAAEREAS